MSRMKDLWQEAFDDALENGIPEEQASTHADDKVADLLATQQDLARDAMIDKQWMEELENDGC